MKVRFLPVVAFSAALIVLPQAVEATVIATINGFYDVDAYDTPSLHIDNSSTFDFTNAQLTLTGYQGLNNGVSQSVNLGTIMAGTIDILTWGSIAGVSGSTTPKNMFAYDYDDQYGGSFNAQNGYGLLSLPNNLVLAPQCAPQGYTDCADVGNFYVTFTATWNGKSIYSQFSPDPTLPGAGNVAGVFVGWEGIDPQGWSETTYDSHSAGGPNGVLADILIGTPPPVQNSPEPGGIALMGLGLIAIAGLYRRKF